MRDDIFTVLAERPRPQPEGMPWRAAILRTVAMGAVPVAVALLAALVHRDYSEMVWPPSPVLALAPLATYVLMTRAGASRVEVVMAVLLSSGIAVCVSLGIALVLLMFAALECLSPNGGCLPW